MFLSRRRVLVLGSALVLATSQGDGQAPPRARADRPLPGALQTRFREPCGFEPVDILLRPAVMSELNLTDEQEEKVRSLAPAHTRRHSRANDEIPRVEGAAPEMVFALRERYHD